MKLDPLRVSLDELYSFGRYVSLSRWVSYWYQIRKVLAFEPASLLVVGIGDAIVIDVLRKFVPDVKTLDVEITLTPDIVGTVESLPFSDSSFELVLCSQVLEHLPFEKFELCLMEIQRASSRNAVISLPHISPQLKLSFKIPLIREMKLAFKPPFPRKHEPGGVHYWEIGKRSFSIGRIRKSIQRCFTILEDFVPFENQYHRFFILEKPD